MRWVLCAVLMGAPFVLFAQAEEDRAALALIERAESSYRSGLTDEQDVSLLILESLDRGGEVVARDEYRIERTARYGRTSREDKILIRFLAPDRERGTWFLSLGHPEEDEQYFKPRDARRARRIRARDEYDRFFGTDFFYRDLRPEKTIHHTYVVLRVEELDGRRCTVVAARPISDPEPGQYGRRLLWVHEIAEGVFVYLKIVYENVQGDVWKEQLNHEFLPVDAEHLPGVFRPQEIVMEDKKTRHRTVLRLDGTRRFNSAVEDRAFDARELERER